jgi:hypothetical protein
MTIRRAIPTCRFGERSVARVLKFGPIVPRELGANGSLLTRRWREMDSNLYGAFPVKRLFWVVLTVFCSERERPFFVPSPGIRFAERAEGVKGPKR